MCRSVHLARCYCLSVTARKTLRRSGANLKEVSGCFHWRKSFHKQVRLNSPHTALFKVFLQCFLYSLGWRGNQVLLIEWSFKWFQDFFQTIKQKCEVQHWLRVSKISNLRISDAAKTSLSSPLLGVFLTAAAYICWVIRKNWK